MTGEDKNTNAVPSSDSPDQRDERDRADMARLAAGHDVALNSLMERHAPKLFNYLIRCLQNEDDAADVAQETFARVYRNRTRFHATQSFSVWLYVIATNLVKDQYRYRTRHPHVSLDAKNDATGGDFQAGLTEEKPTPIESLQITERAVAVRQAVAQLPDELRLPLILAEYEERSQAEIGEILGCTAKAVELRIYRARQQLRIKLSKLLADK